MRFFDFFKIAKKIARGFGRDAVFAFISHHYIALLRLKAVLTLKQAKKQGRRSPTLLKMSKILFLFLNYQHGCNSGDGQYYYCNANNEHNINLRLRCRSSCGLCRNRRGLRGVGGGRRGYLYDGFL